MKYIVIMVVLTFQGDIEYRKYQFINNGKTNDELVIECSNKADEIREKYHIIHGIMKIKDH